MLEIEKEEPEFFSTYKKKNRPHSYQDDCNDYRLRDALRETLLIEQNSQCFYCEKKIKNDSKKVHIDHLKQRGVFHKLECSYANMVLSCNGGDRDEHCGRYKDKQEIWDDDKFLKLLPQNIELEERSRDFFQYISNGEIEPKASLSIENRKRASNTIEYLNLNNKDLVEARKSIILDLELYKQSGFNINDIFDFFNEFENLFKD